MAFKNASRVRETVSNTPNAATAFNLSGAVTSGRTFVAGIGSANTCMYCAQAVDATGVNEAAWEIGVGTVASGAPDTLTRTQIIESSNANAAVDFSTSTKIEVFTVDPAANLDAGGGVFNNIAAGVYHAPINETNLSTSWGNNIRQDYWPIVISRPINITAVAANLITVAAGKKTKIGLHASKDGIPDQLLTTFGEVTTDVAAFKEITGLNYFLAPGIYFLTAFNESGLTQWTGPVSVRDRGSWQGFGVDNATPDKILGTFTEKSSGTYAAGMFNGGAGQGLLRKVSNAVMPFYKFVEV